MDGRPRLLSMLHALFETCGAADETTGLTVAPRKPANPASDNPGDACACRPATPAKK